MSRGAYFFRTEGYSSDRILGPLKGLPNSGAKTQKSNIPATKGTAPITATTMPTVPPKPNRPQATKAIPATIRTMRPVVDAINLTKGFNLNW